MSAAQLIEFKTMMMVVSLRCKSVGVMITEHNDEMAATRRTMFEEADGRVRRFIMANDRPAPTPIALVAVANSAGVKGKAAAKAPTKTPGKAPSKVPAKVLAKAPTPPPALVQAPAKRSRRDDPYEKYLTRVGQTYGMGSTTPGRCRQFDAIALELGDRTSPDRLLTMVADEMIGSPILQKQAACPDRR